MTGPARSDHRTRSVLAWVATTVLAVAIGMALGATKMQPIIERGVSHLGWYLGHQGAQPTCADTGYYSQIKPVNSNAINYYKDANGTYSDDLTSDDKRRTGWVEYNFGKNGVNRDVISWNFAKKSHIKLICVRNGLTDTPRSLDDTGEVRLLHIDCGPKVIPHTFPDLGAKGPAWENYQDIRLSCDANAVVFLIKSIYPARDKSNTDQVAISDVKFYG